MRTVRALVRFLVVNASNNFTHMLQDYSTGHRGHHMMPVNQQWRIWVHLLPESNTNWWRMHGTVLVSYGWRMGHVAVMSLSRTWWRHQMETFSALLAISAGNSPVPGEFPAQRPVTRSFDIFFNLHLNRPLSKQSWGWWFETPPRPLRRHCYELCVLLCVTTIS